MPPRRRPPPAPRSPSASDDSGTVVGHMPGHERCRRRSARGGQCGDRRRGCARCRPRVHWRAAWASISATLTGTGRGGLITLDDVMAVGLPARQRRQQDASGARRRAPPAAGGDVEVLRSLRRAMAQSMAAVARSVDGMLGVRRRRSALLGFRPRLHHAGAARDHRRRAHRAGTECLVRRANRRAARCSSRSTSASRSTRSTACWCR